MCFGKFKKLIKGTPHLQKLSNFHSVGGNKAPIPAKMNFDPSKKKSILESIREKNPNFKIDF